MTRIKEINLEIKKLRKSKSDPSKLEALQAELKELVIHKRLPPTIFDTLIKEKKKKRIYNLIKEKKLIDFQKAKAEKNAEEFSNEIKTGKLYNELRPKKEKKN